MKKIFDKRYVFFLLALFTNCTTVRLRKNNLEQIQVVILSHSVDLPFGLHNEELFDECTSLIRKDLVDTIVLDKTNFLFFELGDILPDYSDIDIRTKVILQYSNGSEKKFFLDQFGHIMYQNKIYKGSEEYLKVIREGR